MRILLAAQFFPPDVGGEERHVANLAGALAARGHAVSVATQQVDGSPDLEVLPSGVRVRRFRTAAMAMPGVYSTSRPHHPPVPDPLAVRALRRIVRQERPDVVHAHNWIVNSILPLRRAGGRPFALVLTLHDYSHACATKRLMHLDRDVCSGPAPSKCLRCSVGHYGPVVGSVTAAAVPPLAAWRRRDVDVFLSVSRAVADGNGVSGLPNSRVIPNFIPDVLVHAADSESPESPAQPAEASTGPELPSEPYLLFVGDLSREKGLHALLAAHERLGPDRPVLVIMGRSTPDTPAALPPRVLRLPPSAHEDVVRAFDGALAAVLPSTWPDPCPTTVLEAMARGKAVVTTALGGMVDMVTDGDSGLLVPPGDVLALETTIRTLVADPELRDRLADGARRAVRAFTASAVVEQVEAVYRSVAGGRDESRPAPVPSGVAR